MLYVENDKKWVISLPLSSSPSFSLTGSKVVESAAILMEFAAAPYASKHGPGNTHHNTVTTPNTLNSA